MNDSQLDPDFMLTDSLAQADSYSWVQSSISGQAGFPEKELHT
jgi:hypothetical protein